MDVYQMKKYIFKQFSPSAIVFSSPAAIKICDENNLTPAEFLRPFSNIRRKQLISSSSKDTCIKDYQVNFLDSYDYERIPASVNLNERRKILLENEPHYNFTEV